GTLTPWHLDVIKTDLGYEFAIQAYDQGQGNNTCSLYYVLQDKNSDFSKPKKSIEPSTEPRSFDNQGIYRSSILKEEDLYTIFYNAVGNGTVRGMSIATGRNILPLNGYKAETEAIKSNYVRVANGELNEYRVDDIDTIYITGNVDVKSFRGGYRNKILTLV